MSGRIEVEDLLVTDGLFSVVSDFGGSAFDGEIGLLEIVDQHPFLRSHRVLSEPMTLRIQDGDVFIGVAR